MATTDDETRSTSSLADWVRIDEGVLRVVDGPDRGKTVRITARPVVLGSARTCDLVLKDPRVSRRHLEVRLVSHGFLVLDLGSRNGTYFEGSRLSEIAVPPGALVRLGHTHVVLGVAGDAVALDPSPHERFRGLVGRSLAMRRIFSLLERAAASSATVLLLGETGCGKDVAARALHESSARASGPFEVLDCGATARGVLASELFGHELGSFTGAAKARAGVFERAHGGTCFLDEVGELPLDVQPALLRVLEAGTVTRLGSDLARPADARIIAATRRDLASEVVAGRFRMNLYYRLQVLPIVLPPLRQRREDLPLLCEHLLGELGVVDPGPIEGPHLARLVAHTWPGNVRELRNVLERALVSAGGPTPFARLRFDVESPPVPSSPSPAASFQEGKKETVLRFEASFLRELMASHDGNVRRAARASGIERTHLRRLLRKHGISS